MARREAVRGEPRIPYTLRIGRDEKRALEAAAAERGLALGTYIRRVALEGARRELVSSSSGES